MSEKTEVLKIALFFFFFNISDSSYSSIITHMFQQKKMPEVGPTSLCITFIAYAISLFLVPRIKISLKRKLILSFAGYSLNFIFGLISSFQESKLKIYALIYSGNFVSGFCSGFLELGQTRYIHLVFQLYNGLEGRGKLFSIFDTFYFISCLLGAFVTLLGLGFFNIKVYFAILVALNFFTLFFGIIVLKEIAVIGKERIAKIQQQPELQESLKLLQISKLEAILQQQQLPLSRDQQSFHQYFLKLLGFLPYLRYVIPLLLSLSIASIVRSNFFSILIPKSITPDLREKYVGVGQIVAGIGAVLGAIMNGQIFDCYGAVFVARKVLSLFFFCCWLHILSLQSQNLAAGINLRVEANI